MTIQPAKRTVFFGPFVGEFGWEMLFWQGWIRKVCRTDFQDWHKVVMSFPGRDVFYPDADEFWPLPEWFTALRPSGCAYLTDGWWKGQPGFRNPRRTRLEVGLREGRPMLRLARRIGRLIPPHLRRSVMDKVGLRREVALRGQEMLPQCERMLAEARERLPKNALVFVPWKLNVHKGLRFGIEVRRQDEASFEFEALRIPYAEQTLEPLRPTALAVKELRRYLGSDERILAVFPRSRRARRTDKNWSREKYEQLIGALQSQFPSHRVALLGSPEGAHFSAGVPAGCIDLINVPDAMRTALQVAALRQADLAAGSISGALAVAMGCGIPVVTWGYSTDRASYEEANFLHVPMTYMEQMDPPVATVKQAIAARLAYETDPHLAGR